MSHWLVDMAVQLEAERLMVYRTASCLDHGEGYMKLVSMAKLLASEIANQVADGAPRIFASYGFATE